MANDYTQDPTFLNFSSADRDAYMKSVDPAYKALSPEDQQGYQAYLTKTLPLGSEPGGQPRELEAGGGTGAGGAITAEDIQKRAAQGALVPKVAAPTSWAPFVHYESQRPWPKIPAGVPGIGGTELTPERVSTGLEMAGGLVELPEMAAAQGGYLPAIGRLATGATLGTGLALAGQKYGGEAGHRLGQIVGMPEQGENAGRVTGAVIAGLGGMLLPGMVEMPEEVNYKGFKIRIPKIFRWGTPPTVESTPAPTPKPGAPPMIPGPTVVPPTPPTTTTPGTAGGPSPEFVARESAIPAQQVREVPPPTEEQLATQRATQKAIQREADIKAGVRAPAKAPKAPPAPMISGPPVAGPTLPTTTFPPEVAGLPPREIPPAPEGFAQPRLVPIRELGIPNAPGISTAPGATPVIQVPPTEGAALRTPIATTGARVPLPGTPPAPPATPPIPNVAGISTAQGRPVGTLPVIEPRPAGPIATAPGPQPTLKMPFGEPAARAETVPSRGTPGRGRIVTSEPSIALRTLLPPPEAALGQPPVSWKAPEFAEIEPRTRVLTEEELRMQARQAQASEAETQALKPKARLQGMRYAGQQQQ